MRINVWVILVLLTCLAGPLGCGGSGRSAADPGGGTAGGTRPCDPPTGMVRLAGRRADFPPSLPSARTCAGGGSPSNYVIPYEALPPDASEELHVVGVYEGAHPDVIGEGSRLGVVNDADPNEPSDPNQPGPPHDGSDERPQGVVGVTVGARPRPTVLFLSAYEPTRWEINLLPGASLSRVIAHGYYEQEVTGVPANVAVALLVAEDDLDCLYGWEARANLGGCNYWTAIRTIRRMTSLTENSFQGCYAGAELTIPHWDGDPPSCLVSVVTGDESLPREAVHFAGCEAIMAERRYCLTTADGTIALVGLDSGRTCPVVEAAALAGAPRAHSIAWRGEVLYACTDDGLVRISLLDGASETLQLPCEAVADGGGLLFVKASHRDPFAFQARLFDTVWAYPDYSALLMGAVDSEYALPSSTRMTASADRLFGVWHASDTVEVIDLPSGLTLAPLRLEDYDDWIWGMAMTDDGELVVSGSISGQTIVVFDAQTGRRLRELALDRPAIGLACASGTM